MRGCDIKTNQSFSGTRTPVTKQMDLWPFSLESRIISEIAFDVSLRFIALASLREISLTEWPLYRAMAGCFNDGGGRLVATKVPILCINFFIICKLQNIGNYIFKSLDICFDGKEQFVIMSRGCD